ncbi:MAG: FtsX-like permease family protein, partial [Saprospiraceae bacterium]|nr:FtsX-like permease family protein [Saprospiraceae bacterium]
WTNWNHSAYETYVKLRPGSGLPNDEKRLLQLRQKYYPEEEARLRQENQWEGTGAPITYKLQPILDMHTQTVVAGGNVPPINPKSIWTLLAIATGVLGIACINFTTLAIGRSAGRSKEVGIRKVMGSNRSSLIGQFLTESVLLSIISAIFGITLAYFLLPSFNELSNRKLVFSLQQFPELSWLYLSTVILTGLAAGSYPALILSGFRPIEILKNKFKLGGSNIFTKTLVTGQFVLSVGLIISTMVILKQIDFMRSKNPGFAKENVLVVDAEGTDSKRIFPLFKQAVQSTPQVVGIAGAELSFGAGMGWSRSGWNDNGTHREAYEYYVDDQFLQVLNMQLIAGRNFDPAVSLDTVSSVIINESMMHNFGWTLENVIGQRLNGYYEDPNKPLPVVIGVVKDFHFRPLAEEIKSQLFHQFSGYVPLKYLVRISAGNPAAALAGLEKNWRSVEPQLPFKYSFLDEDLDRFYRADMRFGGIISRAGGVSIFLACLGLFGLVTLSVTNRMKEIGIRKVLGASVAGITGLLAKDFLKLVLIAILLASPLAWYLMRDWLNGFAYRIELQWWIFAIAGTLALMIAFLTLSVQSVKAALTNPVQSLRPE